MIVFSEREKPPYRDRKAGLSEEEMEQKLAESSTVYVGKLPFNGLNAIQESQIYAVFSQCGPIKRIIMGINRINKQPAGFCFVEYFDRQSALDAVKWINFTFVAGRHVQVDIDWGFVEGRQFARGEKTGYQLSDENRVIHGREDPERQIGIEGQYRRQNHGGGFRKNHRRRD